MKYIKQGLKRGLIGMLIGVFIFNLIGILIALTNDKGSFPISINTYIICYFVSILIGFTFGAMSIVFDIDSWSILKQTVIHFIVTIIVYIPSCFYAKWIAPNMRSVIGTIIGFICTYVCIWILNYFYWKKKISQLNKSLEKNP